jgi:hypothetical protein
VLLDLNTGRRYWVTVDTAGHAGPTGTSMGGGFSDDSSTIAFDSDAQDLVTEGPHQYDFSNVFVRSLQAVLTGSPRSTARASG